jgi:nitrate reductase NapAB chaperone NapD
MPICSYIVHPSAGKKLILADRLSALDGCTAHPADNRELIVLVTETDTEAADKALRERISDMDEVECLALSYANFEEDPK